MKIDSPVPGEEPRSPLPSTSAVHAVELLRDVSGSAATDRALLEPLANIVSDSIDKMQAAIQDLNAYNTKFARDRVRAAIASYFNTQTVEDAVGLSDLVAAEVAFAKNNQPPEGIPFTSDGSAGLKLSAGVTAAAIIEKFDRVYSTYRNVLDRTIKITAPKA